MDATRISDRTRHRVNEMHWYMVSHDQSPLVFISWMLAPCNARKVHPPQGREWRERGLRGYGLRFQKNI